MESNCARLEKLEDAIATLSRILDSIRDCEEDTAHLRSKLRECQREVEMLKQQAPEASTPTLTFTGLQSSWFTKRPFPWFEVTLESSGQPASPLPPSHTPVNLHIRLLRSDDSSPTHILSPHGFSTPFSDGKALIADVLRFASVSSRNGGDYRLEASLSGPWLSHSVAPVVSPPIRVLSERLFADVKVSSPEALSPGDRIARIQGIGKKYTKRFAEEGYHTVSDLAQLNPAEHADRIESLRAAVCLHKGRLTAERLAEIINDCQQAVVRAKESTDRELGAGMPVVGQTSHPDSQGSPRTTLEPGLAAQDSLWQLTGFPSRSSSSPH